MERKQGIAEISLNSIEWLLKNLQFSVELMPKLFNTYNMNFSLSGLYGRVGQRRLKSKWNFVYY
jgi:hypothetical protein